MRIEITEQDIATGKPSHPQECPLGRALVRNGLRNFSVTGMCIVIGQGTGPTRAILLPETVQDWVFDFDESRPVKPIHFDVGLPIPAAFTGFAPDEQENAAALKRTRMFFAQMGMPESEKGHLSARQFKVTETTH